MDDSSQAYLHRLSAGHSGQLGALGRRHDRCRVRAPILHVNDSSRLLSCDSSAPNLPSPSDTNVWNPFSLINEFIVLSFWPQLATAVACRCRRRRCHLPLLTSNQNQTESRLALHHVAVCRRGPLKWSGLDHGTDVLQHAERKGVLAIDWRAG